MTQPTEKAEVGMPSEEPERLADEATETVEEEADVEGGRKAREPHEDKGLEAASDAPAAIQRPPSDS